MDLIYNTVKSLSYVITNPYYLIVLVALGVVLYFKNKKISLMNRMIIGEAEQSALELTLSQIGMGIIAGVLLSILLTISGIAFTEESGIQLLFFFSILLMLIKPRYVCFSYSSAVLGIMSILMEVLNVQDTYMGNVLNIDITMLMSFVAILHIAEAILVALDGHRGAIPVFSDRDGTIIGGYALKRNWIVPIAVFIAYSMTTTISIASESIATPSWWPLFTTASSKDIFDTMIVACMPFWAVIGYSSVTFTKKKKQKSLTSGAYILAFGILLLGVSRLAEFGIVGKIIVVVFAPLAHEFMIRIQSLFESKQEPLFISDEEGFTVLDVVKNSNSYELGFRAGDKILSIDDKKPESEVEIYKMLKLASTRIKVRAAKGLDREIITKKNTKENMGILIVPKKVNVKKTITVDQNKFSSVLDKIKNKQ